MTPAELAEELERQSKFHIEHDLRLGQFPVMYVHRDHGPLLAAALRLAEVVCDDHIEDIPAITCYVITYRRVRDAIAGNAP